MKLFKDVIKANFPVFMGYVSVGVAFGLLFVKSGFGMGYALMMSLFVYAGSMQFIAIPLFLSSVSIGELALVTLLVNLRHVFYGLSLVQSFERFGMKKWYMIFSLTDETYSLLTTIDIPSEYEPTKFKFLIAISNQFYWLIGTLLGSSLGFVDFNTSGLEFALTALFIVLFLEQWRVRENHMPHIVGVVMSIVVLFVFGKSQMLILSLLFMTMLFLLLREKVSL